MAKRSANEIEQMEEVKVTFVSETSEAKGQKLNMGTIVQGRKSRKS